MPVILNSIEYTDEWGNVEPFYRANVGDKQTAKLTVTSNIQVDSVGGIIQFNPVTNAFTHSSKNFEEEGFRFNDTITVTRMQSNGTVMFTWSSSLTYVNGYEIRILSVADFYDITNGEILSIEVTGRDRQSVDGLINLIPNSATSGDASLIDGESSRYNFTSIDTLTIGSTQIGSLINNQSGGGLVGISIKRLANPSTYSRRYEVYIDFINTGFYDSSYFIGVDCLKPYHKLAFSSVEGEPFGQAVLIVNDNANTGFFNQWHNSSITDSSIIGTVAVLDYSVATNFTIIVDGVTSDLGIGACYVSIDDTYFKNKVDSQEKISMIIPTSDLSLTTYTSATNSSGAGYSITVNSIVTVGSETTISGTFTPNTDFNTFINTADSVDRLFYFWVKCGNANLLGFSNQLTKVAPAGGALTMNRENAFFDHAQNQNTIFGGSLGSLTNEYDTEDDLAFYGDVRLPKASTYQYLKCKIVAQNDTTSEKFTLQETLFDLSTAPTDSNGVLLYNQTLTINSELPTTSLKRDAYLRNKASLDNTLNFGFEVYYPFILRWETWLAQLNASVDFFGSQNKNWQQYNALGDWELRFEIEVVRDNLSYTYQKQVIDYAYDNESNITSTIELIDLSTGNVITAIPENTIVKVRATHVLTSGTWSETDTWAQIRVHPSSSAPNYIISTAIDFDNDLNNPLTPLSGLRASLTFPASQTARVECYFDSSKMGGGVSFSAKIKEPDLKPFAEKKTTTFGDIKTTTFGDDKTMTP